MILVLSQLSAKSQFIHDSDLGWKSYDRCTINTADAPVFKTVEVPPVLLSVSEADFIDSLTSTMQQDGMALGTVRYKIWLKTDGTVCLRSIGTSFKWDGMAYDPLEEFFLNLLDFTPGLQRGKPQNCEAQVTMQFDQDRLISYRIANLNFAE